MTIPHLGDGLRVAWLSGEGEAGGSGRRRDRTTLQCILGRVTDGSAPPTHTHKTANRFVTLKEGLDGLNHASEQGLSVEKWTQSMAAENNAGASSYREHNAL